VFRGTNKDSNRNRVKVHELVCEYLRGAPYVDPPAGGEIGARGFVMVLISIIGAGTICKKCDKQMYFIGRVSGQ
jgi:hypothetical protein